MRFPLLFGRPATIRSAAAALVEREILPQLAPLRALRERWRLDPAGGPAPLAPADDPVLQRALKYWRSAIDDTCALAGRPRSALDAINAGLIWSGALRDDRPAALRARSTFAVLVNSRFQDAGAPPLDAAGIHVLRAQAIFSGLADPAAARLAAGSVGGFLAAVGHVTAPRLMRDDADFVPPKLVAAAVRAAHRYIRFSDAAFTRTEAG